MGDIGARTGKFLRKWKLTPEDVDMEVVVGKFLDEMEKGLTGETSSLHMIPTYVDDKVTIQPGESVIVLDAGGTNFRTCVVTFGANMEPTITDFQKTGMPGVKTEVSASEFFSVLADDVERIIDRSDRIGFCYSYAASIFPDHDGRTIVFSKEIKAPEVIGMPIGASLLAELARRGHDVSRKRVSVINDTVATLLATKAEARSSHASGFIGFILGTGTNTAYIEDNSRITKLSNLEAGSQIINVESGGFNFSLGEMDRKFFATTKDPDSYHFEKLISGAYLGAFSHQVILQAIEEGIFSRGFADRFVRIAPLTTTTMSNYLEEPFNAAYALVHVVGDNDDDAFALWRIIDSLIARAAKLTAVNLSATIMKASPGKDPRRPVVINADGTTFYKTENLKRYTDFYLHSFLTERQGISTAMVRIEDSPVIGAAIAGLSL
ncbi:hexokinase family protein [Parasphaerochaeta coccoides]|uniref:Hexokinase n=1 Tax=Parasphaerochaeta coccoides (strain ATCC BAA-1237 / DSM 17374 / SPN1) TaxID=760011 RepID=F4GK86_PARC1|nr:hexokinase [Parasphaerochaeta coccoides]AEC02282.1 Hexokinase [Parasphaerochaeta coccoides DSM 17374]